MRIGFFWSGLFLCALVGRSEAQQLPRVPRPTKQPAAPAVQKPPKTILPAGIELMTKPQLLPFLREGRSVQMAGDSAKGQILRKEGDAYVLADITGPGCLTHLWLTPAQGRLIVLLDDHPAGRISVELSRFFSGKTAPFLSPLVGQHPSGGFSSFPLPFAKSCRILIQGSQIFRYRFQFQRYPPGTLVPKFPDPALNNALEIVQDQWSRVGSDPKSSSLQDREVRGQGALAPGETRMLTTLPGPAEIRAFALRFTPADRRTLRRVLLRITWDDAPTPAVEVPIGDFFATAFEKRAVASLWFARTEEDEWRCFWPMPFARAVRMELRNLSPLPLQEVSWRITYRALTGWEPNRGYFHAHWHREALAAGQPFSLLRVKGRGHLVGTFLALQGAQEINYRAGGERIRVDGETEPSHRGTNLLDYFLGAPWREGAPIQTPLHGSSLRRDTTHRMTAYRVCLGDVIPFQKEIEVEFESIGAGDYAGTAYWYQAEPQHATASAASLESALRAYPAFATPDALEAETLCWEGKAPPVQIDLDLLMEASAGKVAAIPPESATFTFEVKEEDVYALHLAQLIVPGSASAVKFALNGDAMDGLYDLNLDAPVTPANMGSWLLHHTLRLKPGRHTVTLTPEVGKFCLLDYIRIEPSAKKPGVLEAESLREQAIASGRGTVEREDSDERLSGWSGLHWQPFAEGETLTLRFSAAEEGDYTLLIGLLLQGMPLQLSAQLNEQQIGTLALTQANALESALSALPMVVHLNAGEHTLTLTLTNVIEKKRGSLLLDYIKLIPATKK